MGGDRIFMGIDVFKRVFSLKLVLCITLVLFLGMIGPVAAITVTQTAKFNATNPTGGAEFGWPVAISGNTAVVGEVDATVGGQAGAGDAYIFTNNGGTWSQTAEFNATNPTTNYFFGNSVAISGNTAVVGEPNAAVGVVGEAGDVYIFTNN